MESLLFENIYLIDWEIFFFAFIKETWYLGKRRQGELYICDTHQFPQVRGMYYFSSAGSTIGATNKGTRWVLIHLPTCTRLKFCDVMSESWLSSGEGPQHRCYPIYWISLSSKRTERIAILHPFSSQAIQTP